MEKIKTPIFVCGVGRSGTTIFSQVIGTHPDVYRFTWETRFLIDPGGMIELVYALTTNWSPYVGSESIKRLESLLHNLCENETKFQTFYWQKLNKIYEKTNNPSFLKSPKPYLRVGLGEELGIYHMRTVTANFLQKLYHDKYSGFWAGAKEEFNPKIINPRYFGDNPELLLSIIRSFIDELFSTKTNNKLYWLDHSPFSFLHFKSLKQLYPQAKFIVMVRDPRDTAASYLTMDWGGNDIKSVANWVKNVYSKWFLEKQQLNENIDYIELKLEDVVGDPELYTRKVAAYLKIDFTDKMLSLDLSKSNKGRWQKDINDADKKYLNEMLSEVILHYGYKL